MNREIELLKALFMEQGFAEKTLQIQGERVYRVQIGGLRHYRRANGRVYKSLTTFLDQMPLGNKYLTDWKMKMAAELGSKDKVEEYVKNTADYGSALHIAAAEFRRDNGVNWSDFEYKALQLLSESGIGADTMEYALPEFIRDFASLLQFFYDYRVEILAVELPVWCKEGVATLIDLVVEMDAKCYDKTPVEKRHRHKAIINLKSGKKGFFETHVMQLVGERKMFNQVYAAALGWNVTEVYNLAPANWKDQPAYKVANQTRQIEAEEMDAQFDLLLKLGKFRKLLTMPGKKFAVFSGETKYGENPTDALTMLEYDKFSRLKIKQHHADRTKV